MTAPTPTPGRTFRALIVDDDLPLCHMLAGVIRDMCGTATECHTAAAACLQLSQTRFDLVLLDKRLPDRSGTSVFRELNRCGQMPATILLTGFPELAEAVELTQHGLFHYLSKPFNLREIQELLSEAVHQAPSPSPVPKPLDLAGNSKIMQKVREKVVQAANNPAANVLLTGQTGVGKELVAQIIHANTAFPPGLQPEFVAIDCSALPGELIEAELFGAEKGAYTGAYQSRIGLVEAAHGGTVFFDEIGDMPLVHQTRLLRFLETREYRRVGGNKTSSFSGRIIAATHCDLQAAVRAGTFRRDLFYRLEVLNIQIPELHERAEDIVGIAHNLLEQICHKYHRPKPYLRSDDLKMLTAYSFPGNVRELRNILERSLLQTPLQSGWLDMGGVIPTDPEMLTPMPLPFEPNQQFELLSVAETPSPYGSLQRAEYEMLKQAMSTEGRVISRVARRLGVSRQSVLRRLKKWPDLRAAHREPTALDSGAR